MTDRRRYMPYDTYHDRTGMHGNTEAGPSNQASPPFPDGGWPTTQPTGGTSETTADAEQTKKNTEDDETSVSNFYCSPVPHVTDRLFGVRHPGPGAPVAKGHHALTATEIPRMCANCGHGGKLSGGLGSPQATWTRLLVSTNKILRNGIPDLTDRNLAAAEIISVFRQPVYNEDRLHRVNGQRTGEASKKADGEWERRNDTRLVYQHLSRLYLLEAGRGRDLWTMTELVSNGKHGYDRSTSGCFAYPLLQYWKTSTPLIVP